MKHIKTKTEDYYVDDKNLKQGKYKWYYENGKLGMECNYKNDKRNGEYTWYDENGKIKEERFYKDGVEIKDPLKRFILMGKENETY